MRDIRTTGAEKMSSKTKRAIMLHGRKTSVSLEEPFWRAFRLIADERRATAGKLLAEIDSAREQGCNLSSAVRMFVLDYYVSQHERRPPTSQDEKSPLERIRRSKRDQR